MIAEFKLPDGSMFRLRNNATWHIDKEVPDDIREALTEGLLSTEELLAGTSHQPVVDWQQLVETIEYSLDAETVYFQPPPVGTPPEDDDVVF